MSLKEVQETVAADVAQLKADIKRLGEQNGEGKYVVKFGVLFDDPQVEQHYEGIVGTLKAAKKRKVIQFKGEMLLKGMSDNVEITLLEE